MSKEQNIETVHNFVHLFEKKDMLGVSELFAEDGKIVFPYHSDLFPHETVGKKSIFEGYNNASKKFSDVKFPIDEIMPFEDPNIVAVKFNGRLKLKDSPGYYDNDYLFIFYFAENGEILEAHEYFNPVNSAKGFGLMDKLCESE